MKKKVVVFGLAVVVSFICAAKTFAAETKPTANLSQPQFKVKCEFNVTIPMRDGVKLSADVYRPEAEGKFPVLLTRTYYGKSTQDIFHQDDAGFIRYLVTRGYAVVVQDCRGRWDSEGDFYIEIYDAEDGFDTMNWCGTRPWSNGKIGTFGCSYSGCIQWYSAHLRNPYLKCMVPRDATSDPYFDGGFMRDGVYQGWLNWALGDAGRTSRNLRSADLRRALMTLPLDKADEYFGFNIPWWKDYFKHPTYDEYWKRTSVHNKFQEIDVPALNIGGWYSQSDIMGTIRNYLGVAKKGRTEEGRRSQKLFIGPWSHCSSSTKVGEVDFGEKAKVCFNELHLRWYDYWLKGIDTGIMSSPPIKIFLTGMNDWITATDWPLPESKFVPYYLHGGGRANSLIGDGALSPVAPSTEPQDHFTYDPSNPVPTGSDSDRLGDSLDQRPIERRDDVLVFTSEPLQEDLLVVGPVKMTLYAASSAVDTDFTGVLVDVHPNDMAQMMTYGIVRARYRDSYEKPTHIETGKVYEFEIDLWATGHQFLKGHRIRVEVSSSYFPTFLPNTNTGNDIGTDIERRIARQTIYHDAKHPSAIVLPIIKK